MRDHYDFSRADAKPNLYADKIRKEGFTITERADDGSSRTRYFPPGTMPAKAPSVHVYPWRTMWLVRTEGTSRAFRRLPTESEATTIGLALARKTGAELIVHFTRWRSGKRRAA